MNNLVAIISVGTREAQYSNKTAVRGAHHQEADKETTIENISYALCILNGF